MPFSPQPSRPPPPPTAHSAPAPSKPPPPTATAPLRKAKVVYTYQAENHDEVTVTTGEVVEVVEFEDETGQEGWWKVRCGANEGLVPDNFVELLPVTAGEGCT